MHNGAESLPGAVRCVEELKSRGKRFLILSNTSAPSRWALKRLSKYGFQPEDFVGAVTSGEEASKYLRAQYGTSSLSKPDGNGIKRAVLLTWDSRDDNNPRLTSRPEDFLAECGDNIHVAPSTDEADLLLLHGSEVWYRSRDDQVSLSFIETGRFSEELDRVLASCARRSLPMVCANADFVVRNPDGSMAHMPGKIAQRYLDLGGRGVVFG
jgi:ribonucleotide monophosphatase NagD (HAD superfamily)